MFQWEQNVPLTLPLVKAQSPLKPYCSYVGQQLGIYYRGQLLHQIIIYFSLRLMHHKTQIDDNEYLFNDNIKNCLNSLSCD